jgi:DNA-binding phage protein
MERKTVILNTDPEPPETAEEQEPSEHDAFHKAFHVVLNQLVDDADQNTVMDYTGVMSVVMAMFKAAPEGGIARDIISEHLDDVMETLFFHDDIKFETAWKASAA